MTPKLSRFLLKTLAWLPVFYVLWYLTRESQALLMAAILKPLIGLTFPVEVPSLQKGSVLTYLLQVPATVTAEGGEGSFLGTITLDVLIYSCGIPLFMAMMLSSLEYGRQWWSLLGGVAWLLLFETSALYVSLCYNAVNMLHAIGADTHWLMGLPWNAHFSLFAQTTFALVFPSALAVMVWAAFNPAYFSLLPSPRSSRR